MLFNAHFLGRLEHEQLGYLLTYLGHILIWEWCGHP